MYFPFNGYGDGQRIEGPSAPSNSLAPTSKLAAALCSPALPHETGSETCAPLTRTCRCVLPGTSNDQIACISKAAPPHPVSRSSTGSASISIGSSSGSSAYRPVFPIPLDCTACLQRPAVSCFALNHHSHLTSTNTQAPQLASTSLLLLPSKSYRRIRGSGARKAAVSATIEVFPLEPCVPVAHRRTTALALTSNVGPLALPDRL